MISLTEAQRTSIIYDPRPIRMIAEAYGIKLSSVQWLKRHAGMHGTRHEPKRGNPDAKNRPQLPNRHYHVDWDSFPALASRTAQAAE